MRPSQVLDLHVDLVERLRGDDLFRKAQGVVVAAEFRGTQTEPGSPAAERVRDEVMNETLDTFARHAQAAYAYRVTEDMVDLMLFAADSLEPEDRWDASLAPTGCGLVRFDKPIDLAWFRQEDGTLSDVTLKADWALWGPYHEGRTLLSFWADTARPDEVWSAKVRGLNSDAAERVLRAHGRWALVGWDSFRPGISMGPQRLPLPGRGLSDEEVEALKDTPWQNARSTVQATLLAEGAADLEQSNDARYVHALWLLLGQTITVLKEEPLERASKRRAVKKGLPPRVTTIALRRAEQRPREGEETHVEWQHRWIVRGHWRWQACGRNRSERRRIWVGPFVKGPDGKPLKQSEKLYDLRR